MTVDIPGGSLTLFGIFLMGLGLNLTPCVYPMMSVTISLFGGQKETHHGRAFFKAFVYVLGIATMYSSLGVVAAATGEVFGSLLQNSAVLLAISILLFALALSMFDVYTLQMPSWLIQKMGSVHKVNLAGIYLSGLFVGVFAAPCIGPPIIALLTFVGTRGEPLFAFWIFFVMSLGLGTPYLVLGTFSGLLYRLPRSGAWMVWVERIFGTVLVALALFYALLAVRPAWIRFWPSVSLAGAGVYLGFIERSGNNRAGFLWLKRMLGLGAVIAGLALPFFTLRQSVSWDAYAPEKLVQAAETGRPVIMDFYADWCIPCHELDQFTYSDSNVIKSLDGFAKIKVDLTKADTEEVREAVERFEIIGVPTILFLDPQGSEVPEARVTGFIPPHELLSIIRSPKLRPEPETAAPDQESSGSRG